MSDKEKSDFLEPERLRQNQRQQWRHRYREQTYVHTGSGKEGKGGMYGYRNMETYITLYKIDSQWEFAV